MSTRAKLWLITAGVAIAFIVIGFTAAALLERAGNPGWLLRVGFTVLGLTAAFVMWRFLATRWKGHLRREALAQREDEIRGAFQKAKKRLASASSQGRQRIAKLPVVLVLGPSGSAKTTVVVKSGTDPELIAGEAFRDDQPVATTGVNLWYVDGTVVAEAGGALVDDENRFGALLDHIQPERLGPAVGIGEQAPRAAVLCVPCDELIKPGAAEALPALARKLRERLVETAHALGIQLPVYVLFTRADRLPYFEDFVRGMSGDELRTGLGVTLPARSRDGAHKRNEAQRVGGALDRLVHHLALARREILRRESDAEVQAGAYEFPRELGKASPLIREFLVELLRPTQLGVNPFLRAFHFVGVRPVIVAEREGAPAPRRDVEAPAFGATAVFDPSKLQQQATAPAPAGRSRRVPQWVFLEPFFRDVLLGDRSARVLTTGGARVDFLRRGLLTVIALVALILVVGTTVSFRANRGAADRVRAAAAAVAGLEPGSGAMPSATELDRLDSLRAPLAALIEAERDPPLGMRWGLYHADEVLRPGVDVYLAGFERVVGASARDAVLTWMAELPETPDENAAYGGTYDALKAYLILTSHPHESDPGFLGPALAERWPALRSLDEGAAATAHRQIDFYAGLLRDGWGAPSGFDETTVERTRTFLRAFRDADRFYQQVLAEAASGLSDVRFADEFPGSGALVRDEHVVPAAFTLDGWNAVHGALADMDFSAEDWVVGGGAVVSAAEEAELTGSLRQRYEREFVAHWTAFVEGASVPAFAGAPDAAAKLARLVDPQSPILQLLALASRNTRVDPGRVGPAFQPLHAVSPPDAEDRYVGEWNQAYRTALGDLQAAMDQVAASEGPARSGALSQANLAANQASRAVSQMAEAFDIDAEAALMAAAVRSVLEAPIRRAEALITALPAGDVNGRGRSFCQGFGGLLGGFPFQPAAAAEVSMADLAGALQPGTGLLWTFYADVLDGLLVPQGSRYVARPGATPTPTAAFVDFFNRAAGASEAFFEEGRDGPEIAFVLGLQTSATIERVTVRIDGQTQEFTPTQAGNRPFVWQGNSARDASIRGVVDGEARALVEVPAGPWALFRVFQLADWEPVGSGRYRLVWSLPGVPEPLTGELRLGGGTTVPIFQRSFLENLSCVSRIAR